MVGLIIFFSLLFIFSRNDVISHVYNLPLVRKDNDIFFKIVIFYFHTCALYPTAIDIQNDVLVTAHTSSSASLQKAAF